MTQQATSTGAQEWQRLAWAIGAHDAATDPFDQQSDQSVEAQNLRHWAEETHGAAARAFIATHDALQTIRFGPETSPTPWDGPAVGRPDPPHDLEVERTSPRTPRSSSPGGSRRSSPSMMTTGRSATSKSLRWRRSTRVSSCQVAWCSPSSAGRG